MKRFLLILTAMLVSCRVKSTDDGAMPPLRNHEQMSDFVLRSAREAWPDSGIELQDGSGDDRARYKNLRIEEVGEITLFLCRDSLEVGRVKEDELSRASGKDPYRAPIMAQYGNLLLVCWAPDEGRRIGSFMHSVVLDTRQVAKAARDWQRWLAGRDVAAEIPEEGFSLRCESLPYEIAPCQASMCTVGGHKTELLCFPDPATARAVKKELVHWAEVSDPVEGADCYTAYGPYGNLLVMSLLDGGTDTAEPLITGFWSRQHFN